MKRETTIQEILKGDFERPENLLRVRLSTMFDEVCEAICKARRKSKNEDFSSLASNERQFRIALGIFLFEKCVSFRVYFNVPPSRIGIKNMFTYGNFENVSSLKDTPFFEITKDEFAKTFSNVDCLWYDEQESSLDTRTEKERALDAFYLRFGQYTPECIFWVEQFLTMSS